MPSLTETVVGAVVALALREGTPLLWKAYKNRRIEPKKAEQQYLLDVAAWFADRAKRLCDIRLMLKASIIQRSPLFFVRYKGSAGDALSPAPVALVVSVTNTRQVPVTLDGISIDAREASSRGRIKLQKWKKLQYVPTVGNRIYFVYGDFSAAALFDFSTNGLDQLLRGRSLLPNAPVQGWLFFENQLVGTPGTVIQWRIRAIDTAGNKYEASTEPQSIRETGVASGDVNLNPSFFVFTGKREDFEQTSDQRD